jgi:hypothetical protein
MYGNLERRHYRSPFTNETRSFFRGEIRDARRHWYQGWTTTWLTYFLEDEAIVNQSLKLFVPHRWDYYHMIPCSLKTSSIEENKDGKNLRIYLILHACLEYCLVGGVSVGISRSSLALEWNGA